MIKRTGRIENTIAGQSKPWFGKHASKFAKKAITKSVQQQKQPYVSSNINQLFGKDTTMCFISFSLSILVDLFAAKIAGYTFM